MAGPVAGAAMAYGAGKIDTIIDNALGRPFELWTRTVQAENEAPIRVAAYAANQLGANMLPSPDSLYAAYRRGLLSDRTICPVLMAQGIRPTERMLRGASPAFRAHLAARDRMAPADRTFYGNLWENVAYMGMQRPDAGTIAMASARGRITSDQRINLSHGIDASWGRYKWIAEASYEQPGWDSLIQLRRLGRISQADYELWSTRAGWTNAGARSLAESLSSLPSPTECLLAHWRGELDARRLREYHTAHGMTNDEDWKAWMVASKQLPGPSDIVRFAVREAWDHAVVSRWGYDDEFPPEFEHWMKWWGLDWGESINLPDGRVLPAVSWPKAFWRSHWQLMSPEQSYRAYHLLRPERMARYQAIAPGVTPFTIDDLRTILKTSDYPAPMRSWLAAINTVPLSLATIHTGYNLGTFTDAQATELMIDRGHIREDAVAQIDVWRRSWNYRHTAWMRNFRTSTLTGTIHETLAAYKDGVQSRGEALGNLRALGLEDVFIEPALALADAQVAREEVRETLQIIRRAWLQGQLTLADLRARLASLELSAAAQARYLRRWTRQRGLQRRMLSASQLLAAVSVGALAPGVAGAGLLNLNLAPADAALLLSEAVAKSAQRQARDSQRVARAAQASQREQVRALRQAQAAARQLRGQLRTTTPLTAIRRWLQLGIRSGQWARDRLKLLGYDTNTSEAYLSQWVMEAERAPHPDTPAAEGTEKLVRRQTGRSTVKSWWQNGVVTDHWARQRLTAMGYTPDNVEGYIREWRATLGKKPGPASEPRPVQPISGHAPPSGPTALHDTPRTLHQTPAPAKPPGG